ncbi:MAG: DNA pilot protein [Microvirus sp.]|nr:MAG: DNA pilot protein [Microvirus sp.]
MAFSLTGASTGGISGAQIGTQVSPGWGTAIGGAIGGLVGGFSGSSSNSAKSIQDQLNLGIMTQVVNQQEAEKNRAFQAQEALKTRAWQESLSNSAHSREVNDLYAAGLNPILSGTGGSGFGTPTGATASGSQAVVQNPYNSLASDTISAKKLQEVEKAQTAINTSKLFLDTQEVASKINLQNEQAIATKKQGDLSEATAGKERALPALIGKQTEQTGKQTELTTAEIAKARQALDVAETQMNLNRSLQSQSITQSALNSAAKGFQEAQAANTRAQEPYYKNQSTISGYEESERKQLNKSRFITGPIKDIIDTGQQGLNLLKIWK